MVVRIPAGPLSSLSATRRKAAGADRKASTQRERITRSAKVKEDSRARSICRILILFLQAILLFLFLSFLGFSL